MTVLSLPYLGLSIRNWLAISFSGGVYRPEFKSFFLSKKYRLLRCSLLSKLDIWKRIVELVRTCSLWLLHILLLDIFHLNTRCRHTRVHLKFTFEIYIYSEFCGVNWEMISDFQFTLWHAVFIHELYFNTCESFQKYNSKCEIFSLNTN